MHLSIQEHAHARAEVQVQAWAKQAHVQITAVRYHILRNGLILKNIRIQRGDDYITIQHMLIRTNPALLNRPVLHIGSVEISGIKASLHLPKALQSNSKQVWQDDPQLMKIWQATSSLKAQQGQLQLYLSSQDETQAIANKATNTPLIIHNISIQLSTQSQQRSLIVSGRLHEGSVQWQQNSNTENSTSHGQLHWQHINTLALSHALALKPIAGHLQGDLSWQQTQNTANPQAAPQPELQIQSKMQFNATTLTQQHSRPTNSSKQDKPAPVQQLEFSATQQNNIWNIDLNATAWPLTPWGNIIPSIAQHQLLSAQLNGSSHWQETAKGWKISADNGVLQHLVLAAQHSKDDTHWSWRAAHFSNLFIDTALHQVHLSQFKLNDGNLMFNAGAASSDESIATPAWNISIEQIQAERMALSFILPNGKLTLNALQAKATWLKQADLNFNINTTTSSLTSNDTLSPQWRLRGNITRATAAKSSNADFSIRGKHIQLSLLRLLMPLQDNSNSPIRLAGSIDWNSKVSLHQGIWRLQGKASAYDVQLSHAGDNWRAKQVDTKLGPIGMGLTHQTITQIKVTDWACVAALEPLQPIVLNSPETQPTPNETAWWALALDNNNIQIQQLRLNDGQLSVGHNESVWATGINIKLDGLKANNWAKIEIKADVSGGEFKLNGEWDPLSEIPRFRGSATLHAATPFFLHEWMTASGMPRLIRGRLNASLNVEYQTETDAYQSKWQLQLNRGLAEKGFFNNDPMLTRSGLNTEYLLHRLSRENNNIALQGEVNGAWQQQALNLNSLGSSLQAALQAAVSTTAQAASMPQTETPNTVTAHVRLHQRKPLSFNERQRLFKIVRQLLNNPGMSVELKPQWAGSELNNDLLLRIQHTQKLIERFLHHRNISRQRIFPRWPTASEHNNEVSFVQIELKP